jgi:hypothetical protein
LSAATKLAATTTWAAAATAATAAALWTTLFEVWHFAVFAFAWCDLSEDGVTLDDCLHNRINASIFCKTLGVTTHVLSHHCDDSAFCAGACCTARAVKESLVLFWWISMDNKCDVVNVDTACCDVCCNKSVYLSCRQCCEVACTNCL